MILPGLRRDIAERWERLRNLSMRTVLNRFAAVNEFERRASSQNGEDGIIAEIFRRIGTTNRFFVEFGVQDGGECNTALLAREGWAGRMIEGDPRFLASLAARYDDRPAVRTTQAFITAENAADVFRELDIPPEFDLLSIDIDGNDYWVWQALRAFRPRVVVIEYNAEHRPPTRWVMQYNPAHRWDKTTYYGASLASLRALGRTLGYSLVGTERTGVNAFFVRDDVRRKSGFRALTALEAYHPPAYYGVHGQLGHVPRDGPHVEI